MSAARLVFDGITLHDGGPAVSEDGSYTLSVLAEGASFGEPAPVEVLFNSLMRDGALTKWDRDENREMSFFVQIDAPDGAALDAGLAVLHRATHKRTTLEFTPPDGYGETRIYDVLTSSLHAPGDYDDLGAMRGQVAYRLRIVAEPYWRTAGLVSETAEGIPAVGTTADNCELTTGWVSTASTLPAPTTMVTVDATKYVEGAGSIKLQPYRGSDLTYLGPGINSEYHYAATRTGLSITIATSAYVSVAMRRPFTPLGYPYIWMTTAEAGEELVVQGNSIYPGPGIIVQNLADGWTRYTWRVAEPRTITGLRFSDTQRHHEHVPAAGPYPAINIDQIAVAESATLGFQVLKSIEVEGSARTAGSVHIAAPSDAIALGQVVAFTAPQSSVPLGFRPDLRQWHVAGSTTSSSLSPHGSVYDKSTQPVFDAPASLFAGGPHTMVVRAVGTGGSDVDLTLSAQLMVGGQPVGEAETLETGVFTLPGSGNWAGMLVLGTLYLPPVAIQVPSTTAKVRFLLGPVITTPLGVDEVYAFPTCGDLSIVDCGTGTVGNNASSHLWLDAPSADQPRGGIWRSASAGRENALSAWSVTTVPGRHVFDADTMLAFVACTNAQGPTVSFDYPPRRF